MMKTLKFYGVMLMTMVVAFGFTACGDDDDDNAKNDTDYVGIWIIQDTEWAVEATTLNKSSWENVKYWSEDGRWKKKEHSGSLSVNGNTFTINGDAPFHTATFSISGNTMTITATDADGRTETTKMTRATGSQQEKLGFLEYLVTTIQK